MEKQNNQGKLLVFYLVKFSIISLVSSQEFLNVFCSVSVKIFS
ncbi:unnamed protein product [Tenebrio molitor]|nr:unnamed protein product [Tenebrio molitor]